MISRHRVFGFVIVCFVVFSAAIASTGCKRDTVPSPEVTSIRMSATPTVAVYPTSTSTPTPTPTRTPTPTSTPTPRLTITPNAPGIVGEVIYAQPPQRQGFSRPVAVIPAILKIVNETSVELMVTLHGVSDAAPVSPGASTEWQVTAGIYTYSVVAELGGLAFLQDTVMVESGELTTIVIDELSVSYAVFVNQTSLTLTIGLPEANKSFSLGAGQTSEAIPLPPGEYDFTASALSAAPYQESFTLAAGEKATITLIASEVFGSSSVTLNNQTSFSLRLTVDGTTASAVANAGSHSGPIYLPPGTYTYSVCDTATGTICATGDFTVEAGEDVEVTIDSTVISASAVRFQNQTPYELVITIQGIASSVTVPAGGTSAPIDILPGDYTYKASSSSGEVAPFTGSFAIAQGEEVNISLVLTGARASLTIINDTSCTLTFSLSGPSTFTFTVPANQRKTVDIQDGSYTYTATACGASTSGSFTGSQEIRFYMW